MPVVWAYSSWAAHRVAHQNHGPDHLGEGPPVARLLVRLEVLETLEADNQSLRVEIEAIGAEAQENSGNLSKPRSRDPAATPTPSGMTPGGRIGKALLEASPVGRGEIVNTCG